MPQSPSTRVAVGIVGAGASGALTAIQLLWRADEAGVLVDINLIDPTPNTAKGIAYGTPRDAHLLNVPAGRMSAFPDVPDHFVDWLHDHRGQVERGAFVPRHWYGDYLQDTLSHSEASSKSSVNRINDTVRGATAEEGRLVLNLASGRQLGVDAMVLALGSPRSAGAWAPRELRSSDRFVADPWHGTKLAAATDDAASVLLVGTGLTMVDVAIVLRRPGRRIEAVSRNGLRPRAHAAGEPAVATPTLKEGALTLAQVRVAFAAQRLLAEQSGSSWRAAVDSLRPVTNNWWSRLPLPEQQVFVEEYMRSWEVMRHRIAPQVAATLEEMQQSGELTISAGLVVGACTHPDGIAVTFSGGRQAHFDAVVDCTGPSRLSDAVGPTANLVADITARGLGRAHPLGLGLDVAPDGRLINAGGLPSEGVWVIGPLRRGREWETTAIPEIRAQARDIARAILPI